MYYPPHDPYQTDNGHGAIPSSALIVRTLMPVQAPRPTITEDILLIHMRLLPLKLAAHRRVAHCQVPGQPLPARHNPSIPIEQSNIGNVSPASESY